MIQLLFNQKKLILLLHVIPHILCQLPICQCVLKVVVGID